VIFVRLAVLVTKTERRREEMNHRRYARMGVHFYRAWGNVPAMRYFGVALVAVLGFPGCRIIDVDVGFTCLQPDLEHVGPDGRPDPCHEQDAKVGGVCPGGTCEQVTDGWHGPWLVWYGSNGVPSACPHNATDAVWRYADLVPQIGCPFCTCEPSKGSCELPTVLTASSTACNVPGGIATPFNAPAFWNGTCDSTAQVPAGAAMSVTIDPLTVKDGECLPGPLAPKREVQAQWNTYALICPGTGWTPCGNTNIFCVPKEDHAIPGFHLCISTDPDIQNIDKPTCEQTGQFTERHVFYERAEDTRDCKCTCGPAMGSQCTAALTLDQDAACTGPVKQGIPIDSNSPTCADLTAPVPALNGKSSTPAIYHPGTCTPMESSSPGGSVFPSGPRVYCCMP
jgi:hypothetical protein